MKNVIKFQSRKRLKDAQNSTIYKTLESLLLRITLQTDLLKRQTYGPLFSQATSSDIHT